MRKSLGLLFLGLFLTGCYTSSLTMVGPATGVASGKVSETAVSTSINYMVKKQTGKTPIEHVLTQNQIKSYESTKSKLSPCKQNEKLCSIVSDRVSNMQDKLLGLSLQARIEKQQKKFLFKTKKN